VANIIKHIKAHYAQILLLFIIAALLLAAFYSFKPFGAIIANGREWENRLELSADPSEKFISTHVIFGKYKPSSCRNGIYVETADGRPVPFSTENEVYENGLCKETDVVFSNLIYQEPQPKEQPSFQIQGLAAQDSIVYYIYYGPIPEQKPATRESRPVAEQQEQQTQTEFQTQEICYCDSCSSCTDAINNASCTEIRLTQNITNFSGICILSPANFSNKIFDCQGYVIDGVYPSTYCVGIAITNKSNITIRNCVLTEFNYGVLVGDSSFNITITNNTFLRNDKAVQIYQNSSYVSVASNIVSSRYGFNLLNSTYLNISNNFIFNQTNNGMSIDHVNYSTIFNNTITNISSDNGIYSVNISFNNISNNVIGVCYLRGIAIDPGSNNNIVSNNIVYSAQDPHGGISLSSIFWNQPSNPCLNNVVVNNTVYNCSAAGIWIEGTSTLNTIVANNIVNSNKYGIQLYKASNSIVYNNILSGNTWSGIGIETGASNNTVFNNSLISTSGGPGIYLSFSSLNNITANFAHSNRYGIYSYFSNNSVIQNNTVLNSTICGLRIERTLNASLVNNSLANNSKGIYLYLSNNSAILGNTLFNNTEDGIQLQNSNMTFISNNTIFNNSDDGIELLASPNAIISNNEIFNNFDDGVDLDPGSNFANVSENQIYNNSFGVVLTGVNSSIISNNTLANNNLSGIAVYNLSINNTILGNDVRGSIVGLGAAFTSFANFINNTVLSNGVGLYFNTTSQINASWNLICNNSYGLIEENTSDMQITNNTFCIHIIDPTPEQIMRSPPTQFKFNLSNPLFNSSCRLSISSKSFDLPVTDAELLNNNLTIIPLHDLSTSEGNYYWTLRCNDSFENFGEASSYYKIQIPVSGGRGIEVTRYDFTGGTQTYDLYVGTTSVYYNFEGKTYELRLSGSFDSLREFTINGIRHGFKESDIVMVDLDRDGQADLEITLLGLLNNGAKLRLREIPKQELPPAPVTPAPPSGPICGDGKCEGDESPLTCPQDCPAPERAIAPFKAPLQIFAYLLLLLIAIAIIANILWRKIESKAKHRRKVKKAKVKKAKRKAK